MGIIYHLTRLEAWESGKFQGEYRAPSLADEGFIHCCGDVAQMLEVANARFVGQDQVVALEVDTSLLGAEVRFEAARSGDIFPHIYGPLNPDAVVRVQPLTTGGDGKLFLAGT